MGSSMKCAESLGTGYDPMRLMRLYDCLPAVIYVGSQGDYYQCNHGGMEPGYDPGALLGCRSTCAFSTKSNRSRERSSWLIIRSFCNGWNGDSILPSSSFSGIQCKPRPCSPACLDSCGMISLSTAANQESITMRGADGFTEKQERKRCCKLSPLRSRGSEGSFGPTSTRRH